MQYSEKGHELEQRYTKRMDKKMQGKPQPVKIIMSRTFSSAILILQNIDGIPFEQLAFNIYDFCVDLQFKEIIRLFDAELELAGINPEKFIFDLHHFYQTVSQKIRKENKYREFAEYIGMVVRLHREKRETLNKGVIDAYLSMVLQTLEYLRKDKFALNTCAYGVGTDGELLMGPYPMAYSDLPVLEFNEAIRNGKKFSNAAEGRRYMFDLYKHHGFEIDSLEDVENMTQIQNIHSVTTIAMFPFINEFTYDIVPLDYYNTYKLPIAKLISAGCDIESLKNKLRHRNRTLPSNGVFFEIEDGAGELKGALIKEILFHDTVFMLYRLDTRNGSLSGYYDTKEGFLFSITQDAVAGASYRNISALVLEMYATQVLIDMSMENINKIFFLDDQPVRFKAYGRGGKLQNQYKSNLAIFRNLDDYDKEDRYINVIIRKLPEGKQASDEAKQLAAQYGYELEPGQTFVRPFIRQVFVKKKSDN